MTRRAWLIFTCEPRRRPHAAPIVPECAARYNRGSRTEVNVKLTELFLAELDAEAPRTRRALERVPEGKDDWKPHQKSMPLGRLAMLVAQMPSWISLVIDKDDLDLSPPGGS